MRRADDVRDSIRDSHFGHLYRRFEGVRTVVQARKNVAVDVNHVLLARYSNRPQRTISKIGAGFIFATRTGLPISQSRPLVPRPHVELSRFVGWASRSCECDDV